MRTPDGWEGWITPGGGLEPGETELDAAVRELIEEVGIRDAELTGPIWVRRHEFEWQGRLIAQCETFYLARLAEQVEPIGELDAETLESQYVFGHRWWRVDGLEGVVTAPTELARLLRDLIANGPPTTPIDAGV